MSKKPTARLLILDGLGHREATDSNAIANAETPSWDRLWQQQPSTLIDTSSQSVGLQAGQMGNSEVGLRNLGAGQVVFADWLRGSGLLVVLDHGQGYISLYAHNEALTLNSGDWVDAGEVLARSGTNSSDRNAGLYFGIRRNGEPQDPTA